MTVLIRATRRRLLATFVFILAFSISAYSVKRAYASLTWIDRFMSGQTWVGLASDTSGQYLAGVYNLFSSGIQISDNYGKTWHEAMGNIPGATNSHEWTSIASSGDGETLLAAESAGYLWVTHDRGTHWTTVTAPVTNWDSVTMSADGQFGAAIDTTTHDMWLATANLATWTLTAPFPTTWGAVAYSRDGGTLAASETSGYISVSDDQGTNWNTTGHSHAWLSLAAGNGGTVAAVAGYQNVEIVTDYGLAFSDATFGAAFDWSHIAMSDDGQVIAASSFASGDDVQVSEDAGVTWAAAGTSVSQYKAVTSNASGTFLAAGGYSDVWTTPIGSSILPVYFATTASFGDDTLDGHQAHVGDDVTLYFYDYETPLIDPTVSIAGHPATTATLADTNLWTASTVLTADDTAGVVPFVVTAGNTDGTATSTATEADLTDTALEFSKPTPAPTPAPAVSYSSGSGDSLASRAYNITHYLTVVPAPANPPATPSPSVSPIIISMPHAVVPLAPKVRDLETGMSGDDVNALQLFLIIKQTGPAALALQKNGATGFFGALTRKALIEYQKAHKISPAVGYYGPVTRAEMKKI